MRKLPNRLVNAACAVAPVTCGLSIYQAVRPFLPLAMGAALYVAAFLCLTAFCLWVPKNLLSACRKMSSKLQERFHAVEIFSSNRLIRSIVMAIPGTVLGILFAGFNGFLGVRYESLWHGTFAGYFLLLTGLRFLVLHAYRKRNTGGFNRLELRCYTACGILLSALSVALAVAVSLLVDGTAGKTYPGFLVYAMAAYTFYKVYASIRGMVTARRQVSLLLIAQRNIGHADALTSLLCLQTGLLNAFCGGSREFAMRMNGITGGVISLAALVMGISMIIGGWRRRNNT